MVDALANETQTANVEAGEAHLPPGWTSVALKDVARAFISGGTPSTKEAAFWEGTVPWTTSAPIAEDATTLDRAQRYISEQAVQRSASNIVPSGNLLIGTRVGVGKAVVNLLDIAISQDLTGVVVDHTLVDAGFLAYQFKVERIQRFIDGRKRGTTIKGISRFDLESIEMFVPSLPEQRAIARVLRTVQEAREVRRREVALERERKAALMQHLFTHGTRGEPASIKATRFGPVPEQWRIMPLAECANVQTGVAKGRRFGNDQTVSLPYLRVANVQDGYLDLSEIKYIDIRPEEVDRYSLRSGDILLTEGGDSDKLGRGFIWRDQIPSCVHQNHIFAVRPIPALMMPEYFAYLVQSSYGKAYFLNVAHRTTNLASINSTKLKAFPTLVPVLQEQELIVSSLQSVDDKLSSLERETAVLDEAFRALLEEVMTGRVLVGGTACD